MERRGGIELQEGAGGLPHAWPANTHYKATPLPTTSGFLRYFRACSLSPVRQGTPRVPQVTWGVLWERNVCPYWMLMEFPISLYVMVGLLAHIPMHRSLWRQAMAVLPPATDGKRTSAAWHDPANSEALKAFSAAAAWQSSCASVAASPATNEMTTSGQPRARQSVRKPRSAALRSKSAGTTLG